MRSIMLCVAAAASLTAGPAAAAPSGCGPSLPAKVAPKVDPAVAYQEGLAALEAKDFALAEKKFGEVLTVARDNPEANYYLGVARLARGNSKGSVKYFERAIKARGDFIEARERLALAKIELGEAGAAIEQVAKLRDLKEKCGACDAAALKRYDDAIARIEAAMAKPEAATGGEQGALLLAPPGEASTQYQAAVRLINESRFEEAIVALNAAAAAAGPHPDVLNYLGYVNRKLGRIEPAKAHYAAALAIDPDHLGANEYLGELYLEIGEVALARRQLDRLTAICAFGCAEREDLARLIAIKDAVRSAAAK